MGLKERLNKIQSYQKKKNAPIVHTVYLEKLKGETKEQTISRYEAQQNINCETSEDTYVFIISNPDEPE